VPEVLISGREAPELDAVDVGNPVVGAAEGGEAAVEESLVVAMGSDTRLLQRILLRRKYGGETRRRGRAGLRRVGAVAGLREIGSRGRRRGARRPREI